MSTHRIIWILIDAVAGAMFFWTPSIALHAAEKNNFGGRDALVLTLLIPIITITGFEVIAHFQQKTANRIIIALSMIFGIWFFGPLSFFVSASFTGGGFAQPDAWQTIATLTLIFPLAMLDISTYDGTLFAVALVTGALTINMFRKSLFWKGTA